MHAANNGCMESHALASLKDHFLLAMPCLQDSIFAHSLTYIFDHNEHGASGLVINHPVDLTLADIFSQLELESTSACTQHPVLVGGPVAMERGFVLHRSGTTWKSTLNVTDAVCLTTSSDILAAMARDEGPDGALVMIGYAGWGADQLEQELADNAWLTVAADASIIFDTPFEQRAAAAARKLGFDINLMTAHAGHA